MTIVCPMSFWKENVNSEQFVCIAILSAIDQTSNEDEKDIEVTAEDIKDTTDTLHSTSEDKEEENEQALGEYMG